MCKKVITKNSDGHNLMKKLLTTLSILFIATAVQPVHAGPHHFIEGAWEPDIEATREYLKDKHSQRMELFGGREWNEKEEESLHRYFGLIELRRYTFNIEEKKFIMEGKDVKHELEIKGVRIEKNNIFYIEIVGQNRDFTLVITFSSWERIGIHREQPDALDDMIWKRIKSPNYDESLYQYHKEMFEKFIETK